MVGMMIVQPQDMLYLHEHMDLADNSTSLMLLAVNLLNLALADLHEQVITHLGLLL